MPRWKATIAGTLIFKREMTIYACNEQDAKIVAEELTLNAAEGSDDSCYIDAIEVEQYIEPNNEYEVILKEIK